MERPVRSRRRGIGELRASVYVECQISYGGWDGQHYLNGQEFRTWDRLSDGTRVYDWWLNTAVVASDGYSPGMPHCAFAP
ncbi:hypothetical protein [Streptomyces sp. NPDC004284]|uniref:hypothetical protein n=1 Tax=Streptomyces sp. NPDC004284 TaxID=3364695 RepID=UPI00368B1F12